MVSQSVAPAPMAPNQRSTARERSSDIVPAESIVMNPCSTLSITSLRSRLRAESSLGPHGDERFEPLLLGLSVPVNLLNQLTKPSDHDVERACEASELIGRVDGNRRLVELAPRDGRSSLRNRTNAPCHGARERDRQPERHQQDDAAEEQRSARGVATSLIERLGGKLHDQSPGRPLERLHAGNRNQTIADGKDAVFVKNLSHPLRGFAELALELQGLSVREESETEDVAVGRDRAEHFARRFAIVERDGGARLPTQQTPIGRRAVTEGALECVDLPRIEVERQRKDDEDRNARREGDELRKDPEPEPRPDVGLGQLRIRSRDTSTSHLRHSDGQSHAGVKRGLSPRPRSEERWERRVC